MKLSCGLTWSATRKLIEEYEHPRQQWREWFAWYPVRVANDDCRWFETVMRRDHYYSDYEGCGCWRKECISVEVYKGPIEVTK